MAKIIGVQDVEFKGREGNQIKGKNLFLVSLINPKRGQGESCERIFLSAAKCAALDFEPAVGMEVEAFFNRYGKVQTLKQADEHVDFGSPANPLRRLADAENALLAVLRETPLLGEWFEVFIYRRELRTTVENDGTISLQLDRRGYRRYKHRGKMPSNNPPSIDTEKIRELMNNTIDSRFYVTSINDAKTHVKLFMQERNELL